jgi:hypothetical protein
MTHKSIAFKFVVLTTIAVALGILAGASAVGYFASTDQARAKHSVGSPDIAKLPTLQLTRVRLLVSNLN